MGQEDLETRSTTAAEVKSGIQLKPGHKTIVIIGDGNGTPIPVNPPKEEAPKEEPTKHHTWSTEDNKDEPEKPDEPPKNEDKPKEEPKKPEPPPKNEDKPKEEPKKPEPPKATPSVKGSFGAAHFETDKTLPLPA